MLPLLPSTTSTPSKDKSLAFTSLTSDFSDCESDFSASESTVTLISTTSDDVSDKSLDELSPTQKSGPILTKAALKCTSDNYRPKELPAGFCIPTRFGKITDENLKSGKISEVDRAKVIKTVATCVLVYSDSPSPQCCEWLAKQLISKYPILSDADPRSMLPEEKRKSNDNFKYWVRQLICDTLDLNFMISYSD